MSEPVSSPVHWTFRWGGGLPSGGPGPRHRRSSPGPRAEESFAVRPDGPFDVLRVGRMVSMDSRRLQIGAAGGGRKGLAFERGCAYDTRCVWDRTGKAGRVVAGAVRRLGQESIGEMSKAIKCPKCGHANRGDLPICEKCGAPLPVADEEEIMRQAMGASFDLKWALIGGVIIVALQFAAIGVIWGIAGKRFLTGPPKASLLDTTIEGVDPSYGYMKNVEEVHIILKPDKDLRNTADKAKLVSFGKHKSAPYLKVLLEREKARCKVHCDDAAKYESEKKACDEKGREVKGFAQVLKQCGECRAKCQGDCKLEDLPKLPEKLRPVCLQCPKKVADARKAETDYDTCSKRVDYLGTQAKACKACDDTIARIHKELKHCRSDGTGCFYRTAFTQRAELAELRKNKPKREKGESDKDFKNRLKEWKKGVTRLEHDIGRREKRTVLVYRPKSDEAGSVPVSVAFSTGYKVTRNGGYYYTDNPDARPPMNQKKKKEDSPTSHLGFWIMLAISFVLYFVGGMFTGRLSPGITMKEPATAGIVAGLLYFAFLVLIGADFGVVIFSSLIGVPMFAGAAFVGGWAGEKWQGTI